MARPSEICTGHRDWRKPTYFPGAGCVQNPETVLTYAYFYSTSTSQPYTFETKSNKVLVPKQHELRMPFPFKRVFILLQKSE